MTDEMKLIDVTLDTNLKMLRMLDGSKVDVVENSEDLADVKSFLTSHKLIKEIGEIRSINKNPEAPDAHNTLN